MSIANPLPVILGIPLMALFCWALSRWLPLLAVESKAHADSLPIDGLRGVLASSVLFHHAYITYFYARTGQWVLPESNFYAQLGPTAVTMFFFISGFLFWNKMMTAPKGLSPMRLWPNRMRRILPAYWAAIGFMCVIVAVSTSFHLQRPGMTIARNVGEWVILGFPCSPDINGLSQLTLTAGVFWTLQMEALFYFILPTLIWFRQWWQLLLVVAVAAVTSRALGQHSWGHGVFACISTILVRFIGQLAKCFSIGMLVAYQPWNKRVGLWLKSPWATLLGGAIICLNFTYTHYPSSWTESILLAPIFVMIVAGNSFFGVLSSRPMRCLGQVSYSVYILHGLLLYSLTHLCNRWYPVRDMEPFAYWGMICGIGLVVAGVSTLSYWWIERPFLPKRKPLKLNLSVTHGAPL